MKKKFLCLLLSLLTLVSVLTGCAQESDTDINSAVNTSRTAVKLNMWLITEKEVSEATELAVEAAFNAVTEATYTTQVDLIFCTEEEYKQKLDAKFDQVDRRPPNTVFKAPVTTETIVDGDGMKVLKYPEIGEYQMDIVLITGREMLDEYVKEGRLNSLNDSLNNTHKIIQTYIYNDILNNAKVNDTWYAIPNNNVIGNYTYLMVNREMADKYYFNPEDFKTFAAVDTAGKRTAVAELIDLIAENENLDEIAPMYGMAEYPLAKYWSSDGDKSVLSTVYGANAQIGAGVSASNLFADRNYQSFMEQMFYCKENGYFLEDQETFGVAVMEGDYSLYSKYADDYYITVLDYPRLEDDAIFDSMFAVTNYTASLPRAMEIIAALTCKSELRNILQYGVEGLHYDLDDDGAVVRLNNDYMMNINYTGNVMMAYPEEGMSQDVWKNAIIQNQQSVLSVVCGSAAYLSKIDKEALAQLSAVSDSYFERLAACETVSEFYAYVEQASLEIKNTPSFKRLTNLIQDSEYDLVSINGSINQWWEDVFMTEDK